MAELRDKLLVLGRDDVRDLLGWQACMSVVREAMIALSARDTCQLARQILGLGSGRAIGVMTGGLARSQGFGAKLVSVFPENHHLGMPSHQGAAILFDPATGAPVCIAEASEVTRIRTAAASAVATDALARPGPGSLAILGYGDQAHAHAHALGHRDTTDIRIWGRDMAKASRLAARLRRELGVPTRAEATVADAVAGADIICTTTSATTPILEGVHLKAGAHVNLVGSSRAGPAEADITLVARARFVTDSRENVLAQGSELRAALEAGVVGEDHVVAEIGEVLCGTVAGRTAADDITVYKSLGHVVQDMAAMRYLYDQAQAQGRGSVVAF